jgi:hypothetical protein
LEAGYFEEFLTKAEAAKREIEIKKRKSRKYIQSLIIKNDTVQSVPSRFIEMRREDRRFSRSVYNRNGTQRPQT